MRRLFPLFLLAMLVSITAGPNLAQAQAVAAPQLIEAALTSGLLRLDLSEVEFMDSTGLGALITLRNTAHERGDEMELLTVSRAVQRVFALSGLEDVFGSANGSADG